MRPDELHPDDPHLGLHIDHQPVLVAAHVEHHAVVAADARVGVLMLDVLRPAPLRLDGLFVPAVQRASRSGTAGALPELLQGALGDDPHLCQRLPFWEVHQGVFIADVDDQRVLELPHALQLIDDTTELVVEKSPGVADEERLVLRLTVEGSSLRCTSTRHVVVLAEHWVARA